MVFFNYTTMQMTAKIVFYGPGLCGKTTNLHWIHQKTAPKSRGEMVSLETETDRTLFFDLLPIDVGVIGGMKVRLQLYTVPGQVFYNATRKLVLKGVDGVVFVADSQAAAFDANIEAFGNLKENLAELSLTTETIPIVLQYNKRDIRNIVTVEKLNDALNPTGKPFFEAAALHGIGVFETLKEISRLSITAVRKKVEAEDPRRKPKAVPAPPPAAAVAAPAPAAPAEVAAAAPIAAAAPVAAVIPDPAPAPPEPAAAAGNGKAAVEEAPAPAEVKVEFAEAAAGSKVRPVKTKPLGAIHNELEKLRTLTTGKAPVATVAAPPPKAKGSLDQRLQSMLGGAAPSPAKSKADSRKTTVVDVPAGVLKGASSVKVQLTFEGPGVDGASPQTVTITLGANRADGVDLNLELRPKG